MTWDFGQRTIFSYTLKNIHFLKWIFLIWTIFKIFIEFVTTLLVFYFFFFFGSWACEILAPQPWIKPTPPPALEGEVLDCQTSPKKYVF